MVKKKVKSKKPRGKANSKDLVKKKYTDDEKARITNCHERANREPMKIKGRRSSTHALYLYGEENENALNMAKCLEAFGTLDNGLQTLFLNQACGTFGDSVPPEKLDKNKVIDRFNDCMALLNGIHPQDVIEGMLAVQMIGVHNMAMECIGKAKLTDRVDFMSICMNGAVKLSRTFVAQMEALKKYRTGVQQKIVVEHVHVNEGGQAIVGVVNQGGA